MISSISTKQTLIDSISDGLWHSFKVHSLYFEIANNDFRYSTSFSDLYGNIEKQEIEVKSVEFKFLNIKNIKVNKEYDFSLIELYEYLSTHKENFVYLGFSPSLFEFKMELKFGTIDDIRFFEVEIESETVLLERKGSIIMQVDKVLSNDVVKLEFLNNQIPKAKEIYNFYLKKNFKLSFTEYWGNEIDRNKIKQNINGLYIKDSTLLNDSGIQMSLKEGNINSILKLMNFSDDPTLFNIFIYEFIISLNFEKISCGNMNFSKEEWEQFIISNEFLYISKISTIET